LEELVDKGVERGLGVALVRTPVQHQHQLQFHLRGRHETQSVLHRFRLLLLLIILYKSSEVGKVVECLTGGGWPSPSAAQKNRLDSLRLIQA
jgi:hypothetical protein